MVAGTSPSDLSAIVDGETVHVIATSLEGTREALEAATALARGLSGRVVLFLRRAAPDPHSLEDVEADQREGALRRLTDSYTPRPDVLSCVCEHAVDVIQLFKAPGLVVIGGEARFWWPTAEQRLARALTRLGCHVTFVHVPRSSFVAPLVAAALAAITMSGSALAQPSAAGGLESATSSQEPPTPTSNPEWQFGGFLDVGYLNSFNSPSNHLFRGRGTTPRVDELNANMGGGYVGKKASESSRWGLELTAHAGEDSKIFGFSATAPNIRGADWLRHLGPTNVSYLAPVGNGLSLQGGIFSSFIGYDSLYAKDNFTYTRPWTADFTPYLMLGVSGSYAASEHLTATAFVLNGYWHLAHANDVPSVGGQLGYQATNRVTVKQTILYGPHQADTSLSHWRFLSDSTVERRTDRLIAAFEIQFSTEVVDAAGSPRALWVAGQAPVHWAVYGPWSVTVRPEFAWDRDGRWTTFEQSVKAITSTLEYRVRVRQSQAILRLEHRYDNSTGPDGGFFKDIQPNAVGLTPGQHLLVFGWILTFDASARQGSGG